MKRSLSLALPLCVAPLAGCPSTTPTDEGQDTDVVDTQVVDTDVADTDVADTDVADTDVADTDVADTEVPDTDDTDVPNVCGDGTPLADAACFAAPVSYTGEGAVGALAIADWDGSGTDVVFGYAGVVAWLPGDGSGMMGSMNTVPSTTVGTDIRDVGAGHLDSDDNVDLVVGGVGSIGQILLGDGSGGVAYSQGIGVGEGTLFRLHLADLKGSGPTDDVITADQWCSGVAETNGASSGGIIDHRFDLCEPVADVLAQTSSAHTSVVEVEGTTLSTIPLTVDASGITGGTATTLTLPLTAVAMAAGDLDGDQDDEVAVLLTDGTLELLFSDGADGWESQGSTSWVTTSLTGSPVDVVMADVDGDGDLDLAVPATTDDAVTLLINDGTGTLTSTSLPLDTGAAPTRIAAGDLNADGVDDLAVVTQVPHEITVLVSDP